MSIFDTPPAVSGLFATFARLTGHPPHGLWQSPGRVNLVGEHTDYNDGLVLPATIDRTATIAARLRGDGMVRCASLQVRGDVEISLDDVRAGVDWGWPAGVLGALWALRRTGVAVPGLDLVVDSAIPVGAGLASSAALAVATCLAVIELTQQHLSLVDIARACQSGEEEIAGAPTGLMDPVAVLAGRRGSAVLLDCRSLERTLVPFAPAEASAALLVIDTRIGHDNSSGGYRERRDQCTEAAAELGVRSLRDVTLDVVATQLAGTLQRRARHVVTENARVLRVAELLRAGLLQDAGSVFNESHASLRDDFEVSCPELDCAVDAAQSAGAWGARMTGAGWGGCAIALVHGATRAAVVRDVERAFLARGYLPPQIREVTTAAGAARCG